MSKKISRRQFIKGIGVAGMGVASAQLLIACAAPAPAPGAAPDATGSQAAPAATDIVLRVQVAPGGQSTMPIAMAERYQDETGVTVEIEEVIYGEIETKTQTGYISGTNPDLLYGHHRWLFINFLRGIYMELDDMFAADPLPDMGDIYPSVLAGNMLDGKNFSIPGVVHPGGNIALNFNKTMLEEKGLPLPEVGWTWQQWDEVMRAAADPDNGIFGLGFEGMNSFHYYSNISRSFGDPAGRDGWVMNEDGTELLYDQPLHGEVAAWYVGLLNDKVAPRKVDYIEDSSANIFIAGMTATQASNVGQVAAFITQIDNRFEVDAVPLPIGPDGRQGTCYSGNQHMIDSKSAHPEQAYELLKLFSSSEAGVMMVVDGRIPPNAHKSVWLNDEVNGVNPIYQIMDDLLTAGIEPFPMPRNTRFSEANNVFLNEIDLIWEGEETWEDYAPVIVQRVNEVLNLERP
jgi:multiple sugar transport system substrate-binding protein